MDRKRSMCDTLGAMSVSAPATDLQPIKASVVADLIDLVNVNLAEAVTVALMACPVCKGVGIVGDPGEGSDTTCSQCGGVGAIEQFVFDMPKLQAPRLGRLIENWEYKQGQLVPKFRSKTQAFSMLVRVLGLDKAVLEVTNGGSFVESMSAEQREAYIAQVAELAKMGALDG